MDISTITDKKELKSLAYDQMLVIDQAQKNLQLVQQRIAQIEADDLQKSQATKKDK